MNSNTSRPISYCQHPEDGDRFESVDPDHGVRMIFTGPCRFCRQNFWELVTTAKPINWLNLLGNDYVKPTTWKYQRGGEWLVGRPVCDGMKYWYHGIEKYWS